MLNNIQIFKKDNFKIKSKKEDGEILFDAADVAKCLGFVQVREQNGKEYTKIRWSRINENLKDFAPNFEQVKKGYYIPEAAVYLLTMKANSKQAIQFQLWLSTDVLPSIRKYGAYIASDADKETVDKLEKFSKYRIKRTFTNATKENIEVLYNDFLEFIPTMKATDSITAISSAIKGITEFRDNVDSDAYKMLTLEKIKELTDIKATKQNRVNGAIKSHKTRKINNLSNFAARMENEAISLENQLQEWIDYANSLYPVAEEFITIPVHPFSINSMYSLNVRTREKKRSKEYNKWIHNFPKVNWPKMESNKFYAIYLEFEHMEKFDTDNFSKSIVDQIVRETGVDDSNFICISATTTKFVDNYNDGKIHLCIKEIN